MSNNNNNEPKLEKIILDLDKELVWSRKVIGALVAQVESSGRPVMIPADMMNEVAPKLRVDQTHNKKWLILSLDKSQ